MASWLESIPKFRLLGAAVWHAVIVHLALWAVLLPLTVHHGFLNNAWRPTGVAMLVALVHVSQLGVLWLHRRLLASCPPQPFTMPKFAVFGLTPPSLGGTWLSRVFSRLVLRSGSSKASRGVQAALLAATAVSATATAWSCNLVTGPATGLPLAWCSWLGALLGALHTADHLLRGREVLRYPAVHRHRFHRLKAELPTVTWRSVQLAALAWFGATAVSLVRGSALPTSVSASLWGAAAALLSVLCWQWGSAVLQAVHTEPLSLAERGDLDLNAPLLQALGSTDSLLQDIALQDLATFAEARGGTWPQERRAAIFADPSGRAAWGPIAGYMAGELKELVTGVTEALPAIAAVSSAKGGGSSDGGLLSNGVQWNVLRLTPLSTAPRPATREQEVASWLVQARYHRACFCMRALSGLASASMNLGVGDAACAPEDRYGVVLMTSPTLGEVVLALTSCVLAMQQDSKALSVKRSSTSSSVMSASRVLDQLPAFVRACCGMPADGWVVQQSCTSTRQAVQALEDTARSCLYRLVATYGSRLVDAVREVDSKPWYGSTFESEALLAACLRYEA